MRVAPYNPDTLARIRSGASAWHLGWDATFYSRVCRKHGLEPMAGPALPSVLPAPPVAPIIVEPAPVNYTPAEAHCVFDPENHLVIRNGETVRLSPRKAHIFGLLANADKLVSSPDMAREIGTSPNTIIVQIYSMRHTRLLKPLGIDFDAIKGKYGGYRLLDHATNKPLKVHVRRARRA